MIKRPTKMEMNSAIKRLISNVNDSRNSFDIDAIRTIIAFAKEIPASKTKHREKQTSKNNNGVTGHTKEAGNITINTENRVIKEEYFGTTVERVGHYKMRRYNNGIIIFYHFWSSDLTTKIDDNGPTEYCLIYDKNNFEPISFGIIEYKLYYHNLFSKMISFLIWILSFGYYYYTSEQITKIGHYKILWRKE